MPAGGDFGSAGHQIASARLHDYRYDAGRRHAGVAKWERTLTRREVLTTVYYRDDIYRRFRYSVYDAVAINDYFPESRIVDLRHLSTAQWKLPKTVHGTEQF